MWNWLDNYNIGDKWTTEERILKEEGKKEKTDEEMTAELNTFELIDNRAAISTTSSFLAELGPDSA